VRLHFANANLETVGPALDTEMEAAWLDLWFLIQFNIAGLTTKLWDFCAILYETAGFAKTGVDGIMGIALYRF